ncbi:hypothetical protein ACFLSH_03400, partial [Bacteroidota bacterium]
MRLFSISLFVVGLFISGYAQVADNVQKADRYRTMQDTRIIAVSENHASPSVGEEFLDDAAKVELRSNSQLEELGVRYMFTQSSSQLEELGVRYMFTQSSSQLEELGVRYMFTQSSS